MKTVELAYRESGHRMTGESSLCAYVRDEQGNVVGSYHQKLANWNMMARNDVMTADQALMGFAGQISSTYGRDIREVASVPKDTDPVDDESYDVTTNVNEETLSKMRSCLGLDEPLEKRV